MDCVIQPPTCMYKQCHTFIYMLQIYQINKFKQFGNQIITLFYTLVTTHEIRLHQEKRTVDVYKATGIWQLVSGPPVYTAHCYLSLLSQLLHVKLHTYTVEFQSIVSPNIVKYLSPNHLSSFVILCLLFLFFVMLYTQCHTCPSIHIRCYFPSVERCSRAASVVFSAHTYAHINYIVFF